MDFKYKYKNTFDAIGIEVSDGCVTFTRPPMEVAALIMFIFTRDTPIYKAAAAYKYDYATECFSHSLAEVLQPMLAKER